MKKESKTELKTESKTELKKKTKKDSEENQPEESSLPDDIYEIQFADLEYSSKIEKIYHLSDIHIRLQKRHDEYKKVFTNLYHQLKEEVKTSLGGDCKKGLIVITGDILHSKTELSPECVSITADFFQKLAKIMPLVLMAGNHDANLNNNNRMDSLTPIVEKVMSKSQCYYLRHSGFYRFSNVLFGLTSVFDYNFVKASDIQKLELDGIEHKIGLFHGRVDGAITDTGATMEGERGINKKSFDGYDYVLLGDIHKHQFMIENKMAYAGSLIQQNHGESQKGHGYLIWDLASGNVQHKEVKNDFGYITLQIKGGKLIKPVDCILPSKCYLRLEIDDKTTREEQKTIIDEFNQKRTILELIQTSIRTVERQPDSEIKTNNTNKGDKGDNTDTLNTDTNTNTDTSNPSENSIESTEEKMLRALSFNISNYQFQNKEIEKFLKAKSVSDEMIEKVKKINTEFNQQILISDTLLGGSWKLKSLEFSNLFCYGPDNIITFDKSKGIVGIVAPNHSGKSSILDVILFTLFDKTSRKGSGKEVMRLGEKSFKSKLEIEMGDKTFVINKKGSKKTNDVMSNTIEFAYYSKDLETDKIVATKLTGKTPAETRKVIESYFGTFDDMIMTSISLQNNNTQFADSTTSEKRKEFEKLLRIDIFERLKELSFDISREKKAVIKHITNEIPEEALKNLLEEHLTTQDRLKEIESQLIEEKEELSELRNKESGLMIRLSSAINLVPSQYKELAKSGKLESYRDKICKEIEELKDQFDLEAAEELFSTANLDEWKVKESERKTKLKEVESRIDKLSRNLHPIKKEVEKPLREKADIESELETTKENLFTVKKKIKSLKECDWEEKNKVIGICNSIVDKQLSKYPKKGKLKLEEFYDDLALNITEVLDTTYQPGSKSELNQLIKESESMTVKIDKIGGELNNCILYHQIIEWKSENETIQKDIDVLKKKKKKLEASEFDLGAFMDYQKLCKMEIEFKELEIAFENISKYSETHNELNKVMQKLISSEKFIVELEEARGNFKGTLNVIEAEMKNIKDKRKKLEELILDMDVLLTYQDCLKTVPFLIIDKIIPQLERTVNQMLTSVVNFTLNFIISEKELNVYISRPHGNLPLSNASGFEKFVGSLFLRIGLIKISNLPKANFLAIDEGWSNFDYENMNNVSMIMDYLRNEFDFVILVSHLQGMREQTDQQINIDVEKKTGGAFGVSTVVYPRLIKNDKDPLLLKYKAIIKDGLE